MEEGYNDVNEPLDHESEQIIDQSTVSPRNTASKWGLYGALASIAVGLIFYLTGLADFSKSGGGTINQVLSWAIWIGTIVWAIKVHRDEDLGGFITFGRAFGTGALTGVFYALISAVWAYVFFTFVAPDAMDMIRNAALASMEERGMTEDQIEASSGMMDTFTSPGFISLSAGFITAIGSCIIALIAGAIMKREPGF